MITLKIKYAAEKESDKQIISEYQKQYLKKIKEKTKNVIFPVITKSLLNKVKHSLEEVKCFVDFVSWKQIASELKKSGFRYRFPLDERVFQSKTLRFVNVFM